MKKRVLIVGIDSTIGAALSKELSNHDWEVLGTTRKKERVTDKVFYLDLLSTQEFNFLLPVDAVFLCASVTKMTSCRENAIYAEQINQTAQTSLAKYFINKSIQVIFLSTSAVFDGRKPAYKVTDKKNPLTPYGKFKANVEDDLISYSEYCSIVRLTKVLTPYYPLLLGWIANLRKGYPVEPFKDLYVCPISINVVVECLRIIVEKELFGIMHISGEKDVTYQNIAEYLEIMMGLDKSLITPASAFASGVNIEEAPLYTSLDMSRSKKLFKIPNVSLQATLNNLYGDFLWDAQFVPH